MASVKDWPNVGDYHDALQYPRQAFRTPDLQAGTVEANKLQVPRARAGAFANVYKLMNGSTAFAVRLFKFPNAQRQERYLTVSKYLDELRRAGKCPKCLVKFGYEPEGIRTRGDWFPVLMMEWVKGINFGEWVRDQVQKKDQAALTGMAERWVTLLEELQAAKLAHGDLQHDNVMVVNGEPKLVDYDCLTVPALYGEAAFEYGKPAYQHPRRKDQPLSADLDHFSAWVILIALRALAVDLSLYQRYVVKTNNENLLFSEADIRLPDQSGLWRELLAFGDLEVRGWATRLRSTLPDQPFDRIPEFVLDPFKLLREACKTSPLDWARIDQLATTLTDTGKAVPTDCASHAAEARKRVASRERLHQAVRANDTRAIVAAYQPTLIDDWWPCKPLADRAKEARDQVKALEELEASLRNSSDGRAYVSAWAKHGPIVASLPEAVRLKQAAESWLARIAAAERFLAVLMKPTTERALAAAWQQLAAVKGHPDADKHRARAEQAESRADKLEALRKVPDPPAEDADRQIVSLWNESLFQGCTEADPFRTRFRTATARLKMMDALRQACDAAYATPGKDAAVLGAADLLPKGYKHSLLPRVRKAGLCVQVSGELADALSAKPQSDKAIAAAFEKARDAGTAPTEPQTAERCRRAIRRRDLIRQLEAAAALPADEQDAKLIQLWDDQLLGNCPDAAPSKKLHQQASKRQQAWRDLEAAVHAADTDRVATLATDPLLAGYPPLVRQRTTIDELVRKGEQVRRVTGMLQASGPPRALTPDDLAFLRDNPNLFAAQRGMIEQALATRLRDQVQLKASTPAYTLAPGGRLVTVRWGWPDLGLVSHCHVATDPERFLATLDEADPDGRSLCRASDHHHQRGGFALPVPMGWRQLFVTIWPAVDLGWTELLGPPLHLGPVQLAGGRSPAFTPPARTPPRKGWLGGMFSG